MKAIILIITFIYCSLFSTITPNLQIKKHLKKMDYKNSNNNIENVDFIYLINLDKRKDRWERSSNLLLKYNIIPHRFSAVNGWNLSSEDLNDLGVKYESWMDPIMGKGRKMWGHSWRRHNLNGFASSYYSNTTKEHTLNHLSNYRVDSNFGEDPKQAYFVHCCSPGQIGCALSHLSVLQDAYDSRYENIWVLEDDIAIAENPHVISELITELNDHIGRGNWDILFTDKDYRDNTTGNYVACKSFAPRPNFYPNNPTRFSLRYSVSKNIECIGARYGTASMIISRSGMEKILNFIYKYNLFLPIDFDMCMPDDIKLFCLKRDIVYQDIHTNSNISNPP